MRMSSARFIHGCRICHVNGLAKKLACDYNECVTILTIISHVAFHPTILLTNVQVCRPASFEDNNGGFQTQWLNHWVWSAARITNSSKSTSSDSDRHDIIHGSANTSMPVKLQSAMYHFILCGWRKYWGGQGKYLQLKRGHTWDG